jgi:hypothetical protein
MNPAVIQAEIVQLISTLSAIGTPLQVLLPALSVILLFLALVPDLRRFLGAAVTASAVILLIGEGILVWFHWRLYQLAVVVSPDTGQIVGRVAVPLWIESEKLYVWALTVAILAVFIRGSARSCSPE